MYEQLVKIINISEENLSVKGRVKEEKIENNSYYFQFFFLPLVIRLIHWEKK
jgi:hypothetical protein